MTNTILFTAQLPGVYELSQLFDSVTNPTGSVIPRPGSLVFDPSTGLLQTVKSVNATTMNSILGPVYTEILAPAAADLDPNDPNVVSIIDYGNSRFYMFYDQSEIPTKITIDKKVIILGDDAATYDISQWNDATKQFVTVSLYYDTDGVYRGTKSPLAVIGAANNAKVPTNCNMTVPIIDDQIFFLNIYDYSGTQCGSFKLFAKKALINNDTTEDLIIENFTLQSTQMNSDGFYIYPQQDPSTLVITPIATYNNGVTKIIPIDGTVCHLYGLENFEAAYPGQTIELVAKYFLNPDQQAAGSIIVTTGATRYLTSQVKLTVTDPGNNDYTVKISAVPMYLPVSGVWTLLFFL